MVATTTEEQKIKQARNLLVDWVKQHRAHCDNDCGEVGNVLAFLAHSMGATEFDLRQFPKRLVAYDIDCQHKGEACEDP